MTGCSKDNENSISAKKGILAQVADTQIGFQDYEGELARLRKEIDLLNECDCQCVVICGDFVHDPNSEMQKNAFLAELARLRKRYFLVRGNHERNLAQYLDDFGPSFYASELPFDGYRLVVMDTNYWMKPDPVETEKMDALLLQEMENAKSAGMKLIVAGHSPIFVNDVDEDEEYFNLPKDRRAWLGELFRKYPVAVYMAGHTHTAFACLWNGVLLSNSETTSVAFDKVNYGFRRFVFDGDLIRFNAIPVNTTAN